MYLIRPPKVYRWLFKKAVFRENPEEKMVYLTFDDGPHPEATPYVLSVLKSHGIKATFFVLGKNVNKHPELFKQLKAEGHGIGNHGMHHPKGWTTAIDEYIEDVALGKQITKSNLFRPPYGKLTISQYNRLVETEKIVFWDVISGDFDQKTDSQTVVRNVLNNVRNGSVIVMHDSKKAMNNVMGSMNEIIIELKEKGYAFGVLQGSNEPQY
ncbi:MAG TPA: polysaccharide deacetylase family protein [Flavobacteriales bacterium]|nr:polysaccharide deacetylase family protein [Flavobacteriales bacterium]